MKNKNKILSMEEVKKKMRQQRWEGRPPSSPLIGGLVILGVIGVLIASFYLT